MMTTTARCFDTCCVPENDGPTYVKIAERGQRSTKEYQCMDCGETMPVGTWYNRTMAIFDGVFEMRRSHSGDGACVLDQGTW